MKVYRIEHKTENNANVSKHILVIDGKEYEEVWVHEEHAISCDYAIESQLSDNNYSFEFIRLFKKMQWDTNNTPICIELMEEILENIDSE